MGGVRAPGDAPPHHENSVGWLSRPRQTAYSKLGGGQQPPTCLSPWLDRFGAMAFDAVLQVGGVRSASVAQACTVSSGAGSGTAAERSSSAPLYASSVRSCPVHRTRHSMSHPGAAKKQEPCASGRAGQYRRSQLSCGAQLGYGRRYAGHSSWCQTWVPSAALRAYTPHVPPTRVGSVLHSPSKAEYAMNRRLLSEERIG